MNSIKLSMRGDGAWKDLPQKEVIHVRDTEIGVAVLANGMVSGRPSVSFRIDLPDGPDGKNKVVIFETSGRLLITAAQMIAARFPDLLKSDH